MYGSMTIDGLTILVAEQVARADNRSGKGCWYKIIIHECPICGAGETYKYRQYGPRPPKIWDQYEYVTAYDYCNAL